MAELPGSSSPQQQQHTCCLFAVVVVAVIIVINHHHRPDYRHPPPPPAPCCLVHPACMHVPAHPALHIAHCTLHSCTALAGPLRPLSSPLPSRPLASAARRVQGPWPTDGLPAECASDQMKCTCTGRLRAFIVQPQTAAASAPRSAAWARRAWRKTMVR
jgi:hypothetical protein